MTRQNLVLGFKGTGQVLGFKGTGQDLDLSQDPYSCISLRAVYYRVDFLLLQAKGDVQIAEQDSLVSGTLYMAGKEHQDLLNEVYASYAHTNPLHTDVFPSLRTLEAEVIAMTAALVGGQ